MTKAEKEHLAAVASLGCIICESPAEVHHITGAGMGLRSSHFETIPLCPFHHRHGGFGECVHNGTRSFERKYGTQHELLKQTLTLLGIENAP